MKKSAWAYSLAVLILLVSFQNCQQPPHPDELNGNVGLNTVGVANKVDLRQESVKSVEFLIEDLKSVQHTTGNVYQVKHNKVLDIDLISGQITVTNDFDPGVEHYCLTEELKAELIAILTSAQVCKKDEAVAAGGRVCAQVIQAPYANLYTDREQFSLGYATDACGSHAVDLCGEHRDLLQGYIQSLKSEYSSLSCH